MKWYVEKMRESLLDTLINMTTTPTQLSLFERAVIEFMIAGDDDEPALREQLKSAVVVKRDYTDIGVFVKLHVAPNAPLTAMTSRYLQNTPMAFLKHPDLSPGGQAMLWFKDARMNTLECVTIATEKWPSDESKFEIEHYGFPGKPLGSD